MTSFNHHIAYMTFLFKQVLWLQSNPHTNNIFYLIIFQSYLQFRPIFRLISSFESRTICLINAILQNHLNRIDQSIFSGGSLKKIKSILCVSKKEKKKHFDLSHIKERFWFFGRGQFWLPLCSALFQIHLKHNPGIYV